MKPDIHPAYNETTVTCGCGNTFTTRSTSPTGQLTVEVCSACHPFYTGKQKILDTGGRVARFEKRFGKRARPRRRRDRRQVAPPTAPVPPLRGAGRAPFVMSAAAHPVAERSPPMSSSDGDLLGDLLDEHASLERELADPAVHTDQSRARRLSRRYAQLAPLVETARALDEARGNLATARELAGEDASFAAEAGTLETAGRGAHRPAARAAAAEGPRRRQGRHPRDQGGGGRCGVGAVRRRPAAHVPALRRAPRLVDRDPRRRRRPTSAATRTSPSR